MTARAMLLLALSASALAIAEAEEAQANPLRKIVTLLQNLRHETEAEGEKSKELYEKFMCYCETTESATQKSVDDARSHVGALQAQIKELSGSNAQLEQEVKDLKEDIEENTKGVEEATGTRKKEQSEYTAEAADTTNSIAALDKAIPAIEKGLPPDAAVLTQIAARLLAHDRDRSSDSAERAQVLQTIMLQMQNGNTQPAGGTAQILGVLQQMRDDFKANLGSCTKEEEEANATYDELMGAKGKQITASTRELEEKQSRLAGQKQALADAEEDLEDTSSTLAQDEKFLYNLKQNCAQKTKEFEAEEKERQLEVVAIADTIKILNDDDAQEMFKKTLPSPAGAGAAASFLQVKMRNKLRGLPGLAGPLSPTQLAQATRYLREASLTQGGSRGGELGLLAAQIRRRGRQPDSFAPLKNSVNQMIGAMQQEQADDDKHRDYCKEEMNRVNGEKADLEEGIEGTQTKITDAEAQMKVLSEEITTLNGELKVLEANLVQATAQREQEKAQNTQTLAELQVSASLLDKAKEKLSSYYGASAALVQEQAGSSENDRWAQSLLSLGQDSSSGGDSFLQSSQPGNRGAAGGMIVGMLEELKGELKTSMAVTKQEEADAQTDYETFSADTASTEEAKKKQVIDKEGNLATLGEAVQDLATTKDETNMELNAVLSKLSALTADCSFLLENYDVRKKARSQELEGLNNALSVLSGADFS